MGNPVTSTVCKLVTCGAIALTGLFSSFAAAEATSTSHIAASRLAQDLCYFSVRAPNHGVVEVGVPFRLQLVARNCEGDIVKTFSGEKYMYWGARQGSNRVNGDDIELPANGNYRFKKGVLLSEALGIVFDEDISGKIFVQATHYPGTGLVFGETNNPLIVDESAE